jgi:hypothetical protein
MTQVVAEVTAKPFTNGQIDITVDQLTMVGDEVTARERFSQEILYTKEERTHQALIQLGWTPPSGEAPVVADEAMLVDAIIGKGFSSDKHKSTMMVYGWANKEGWNREALAGMKLGKLLAIYTEGSLNG